MTLRGVGPMRPIQPLLCTKAEAAALLHVSVRTIHRLVSEGKLKTVLFGKHNVRLVRASLIEFVSGNPGETAAERAASSERGRANRSKRKDLQAPAVETLASPVRDGKSLAAGPDD